MGLPSDAREEEVGESGEAPEPSPGDRRSGTHRKPGGIIDVVSQVGERLKTRQSRPAAPIVNDADDATES
ncbi:MAG: hypothetical protein JRH11_04920 [Deltaproteobacteria bacterium]|nr:hypothetical protein [Deltaproteobacteria bacterium]